jgi:hypothetical protein
MKKQFLLFLAMASGLVCLAQTKPHNSIGISLGWQNFTFLDKHVSPLTYSTNSLFPKIGLFYNKQAGHSILNVQLAASKGSINPTRFGERSYKVVWNQNDSFQYNLASGFVHAGIEASYLLNVSSLSDHNVHYWVGGTVN